jgi:hypothetical protein
VKPSWLARRKYQAMLVALLLFLVAYPILRGPAGSPVLARVLLTGVFVAGGWVVFAGNRFRAVAVALGVPALLGAWTGYALPELHGPAVAAFFHVTAATFHAFVLFVLLRGVHREPTVSADAVAAALCGYLLIGVAFGHAYCLLNEIVPGSFGGLDRGGSEAETHFRLTYFSFITLTTVGYGDITPTRDTARSLAVAEAVTGQFYLAVLVADLIGKRVAQALSGNAPPPE